MWHHKRPLILRSHQRITDVEFFHLGSRHNSSGLGLVDLFLIFPLGTKQLGEFDRSTGVSQENRIPTFQYTLKNPYKTHLADKFIGHNLKDLSRQRSV